MQNRQVSLGTWQQIPDASVSELLGSIGFDWVTVDMEHGSIGVETLTNMCRAIELGGALPIVRISESNRSNCKQAMDAGAGGVVAPMIENASQLIEVKNACCYPPSGNRGVGFSRANSFGEKFNDYLVEAQNPIIVAQIEHVNAIENLEEILRVKGLDAIIIGPYDLSASMGITAKFDDIKFIDAINEIDLIINKSKVASGYHVVQPDQSLLDRKIDEGYCFIAYSIDAVFMCHSAKKGLKNYK